MELVFKLEGTLQFIHLVIASFTFGSTSNLCYLHFDLGSATGLLQVM